MITIRLFQAAVSGVYRETDSWQTVPGRLSDILRERNAAGFDTPCGGRGVCGKCRVGLVTECTLGYSSWAHRKKVTAAEVRESVETVPACQVYLEESAVVFADFGEKNQTLSVRSKNVRTCRRYGAAVDLGTTNVEARLTDLDTGEILGEGAMPNGQSIYGRDLISRLSAVTEGGIPKREECRNATVGTIGSLLERICRDIGCSPEAVENGIERAVIAGNTVMTYFLLGIDAAPLKIPPYAPPILSFPPLSAPLGELPISAAGEIYPVPLLAGLIGGDLTAGIIALNENPDYGFTFGKDGPELLIDIGTNGEILLFTGEKIYAAQTAAGPVFEGEEISCGTRYGAGVVKHLDIEGNSSIFPCCCRERFRLETAGGTEPCGLAGTAIVDLLAELLRTGDVDRTGRLKEPVRITDRLILAKTDVRAVQLAVGAIRAGSALLLEEAGLAGKDLKNFYAAGGLGSGLRIENAKRIGLFPSEVESGRIILCGNTSLEGAAAILRSPELLDQVGAIREKIRYVQLGGNPRFNEEFVRSMTFPS